MIFSLISSSVSPAAGLSTTTTTPPRFGSHQCLSADGMSCLHGGLLFNLASKQYWSHIIIIYESFGLSTAFVDKQTKLLQSLSLPFLLKVHWDIFSFLSLLDTHNAHAYVSMRKRSYRMRKVSSENSSLSHVPSSNGKRKMPGSR